MINPALIKLGRLCTRLSGFARSVGRRVAADGSEAFRQMLGGREFVDLYEFQIYLGETLELLHAELVALEDLHERHLRRAAALREQRQELTAVLRAAIGGVERALSSLLGPEIASRFLGRFRALPEDPETLQPLAERLFATLTDPAFELPILRPGVEIDPLAMAHGFEGPMRRLGATLPALSDAEAAERHGRARQAEAFERLKTFAGRVERFYGALYEVTGNPGLAKRLRKARLRKTGLRKRGKPAVS